MSQILYQPMQGFGWPSILVRESCFNSLTPLFMYGNLSIKMTNMLGTKPMVSSSLLYE